MIVYLITNTTNGKRYIGQTTRSINERWARHKRSKSCPALKSAIDRYGVNSFIVEVLVDIPTKELADEFEKEFIDRYCSKTPNGYNISIGGERGRLGATHSPETRKLLSEKAKGNKCAVGSVRTLEMRRAASDVSKRMSQKQRLKLREARLMQPCPRTGKRHSDDAKLRMSEAHKMWWENKRRT